MTNTQLTSDYLAAYDFYSHVEHTIIEPMIAWLCQGRPLYVLDAGCGKGMPAFVFARHGCTVDGIDLNPDSLKFAEEVQATSAFGEQLTFRKDDLRTLPFADSHFDLVWTSYVLHHIADKAAAVRELHRVLKPEGILAIREGGLPLQMFPGNIGLGEPGLDARLQVANNRWFAAMSKATMPDEVVYPYGWAQLLLDGGFAQVTARTFTVDMLPPFNDYQQAFVLYQLQRTLDRDQGSYGPILTEEDRFALQQLLDPASPHYILQRQDLHVRYGLSVYLGKKEK